MAKRRARMLLGACAVAAALGASGVVATPAHAAFGVTSNGGYYIVDSGAGLVFRVSQSNGDVTSMQYNGTELLSSRASHVQSGLGSGTTVTAQTSGNSIIITEHATNFYGSGTIYHYLVVRSGDNNIYMATYADSAAAGELRWYSSFNGSVLTEAWTPSTTYGGSAIESSDVYALNGQTRSKYYSNRRAMDLSVRGLTGSGVGVFMAYGNRESSAGGPFFRDIEQEYTGNNDLYNYLWSGHNQTEEQRLNVLYGPYALMVTDGSTPSTPGLSFMWDYGFQGSVGDSGRGWVVGKVIGVDYADAVVGWANSTAQYWAVPNSSTGNFSSPAMKAGTYTQALYQGELAVATRTVTVTAGATTTGQNITSTWTTPDAIFRIGDWDGTPSGFKNAANGTWMHPSDSRNASWGPTSYTVGSSATSAFPAYQWKDINNPTTATFTLTSSQITARTVRIGLTAAYAGGRPQITVNGWTSSAPSASSQPGSRSLTIGTYRGNNALYTYSVPASAFVAGTNTLTITAISGSSGSGYLSPGYSYDCVELY